MIFRRAILIASLLLPAAVLAAPDAPVEAQDYTVLTTPVQTQDPQKIEVLGFFAYTCPHCLTYEGYLLPWAAKLPEDVEFRLVPVAWSEKYTHFSQTYYALEAMGKLEPYHLQFFNAVIKEGMGFPDIEAIADYMGTLGLDKDEFLNTANSFSVKVKADRAFKTWTAYGVDGTPTNAVNGKYLTAPYMAGTWEGALEVMDYLIAREREAIKNK